MSRDTHYYLTVIFGFFLWTVLAYIDTLILAEHWMILACADLGFVGYIMYKHHKRWVSINESKSADN